MTSRININDRKLAVKLKKLKNILRKMGSVAVAFSGGVDSTFLLRAALDVLGKENVIAVTSSSNIHPSGEIDEAEQLAEKMGVEQIIINPSSLDNEEFIKNNSERCYYCKKDVFSKIKETALEKGYNFVVDGTNFNDSFDKYRPGMKAAEELNIKSPLRDAQLRKNEIRKLSREMELSTWNKPSMACLATRIPYGRKITADKLKMIDQAEVFLRKYGFEQLRLRQHDRNTARIEVLPENMPLLLKHRKEIIEFMKGLGYTYVTLDIEGYRTGSMNEINHSTS